MVEYQKITKGYYCAGGLVKSPLGRGSQLWEGGEVQGLKIGELPMGPPYQS